VYGLASGIRAQDLPKSNVLSITDLSQYATLDRHSKKQRSQSPLKKLSTLSWTEEFVFHINDATHDMVISHL
jgi:hypothetical protein